MEVIAKAKYIRISPKKSRQVIKTVVGKSVNEALAILSFMPQKSSFLIAKLIKSALSNAQNNYGLSEDNLFISKLVADQGPKLKRIKYRARGSRDIIQRPTSHFTIVLSEYVPTPEEKIKKVKEDLKREEAKRAEERAKERARLEKEKVETAEEPTQEMAPLTSKGERMKVVQDKEVKKLVPKKEKQKIVQEEAKELEKAEEKSKYAKPKEKVRPPKKLSFFQRIFRRKSM